MMLTMLAATSGVEEVFAFNISGLNVNLRSAAVAAGWNQSSAVVATVSANIGSSSTSAYGLVVSGSFPKGVKLVVPSGRYVVGAGGLPGGGGLDSWDGTNWIANDGGSGGNGGNAIQVAVPLSIQNSGVLGGGGGGGGGGRSGGDGGPSGSVGGYGAGYVTGGTATITTGGVDGSSGGNLGSAGASDSGTVGGAPGQYLVGNSFVTWLATGTRLGTFS